MSSEYMKVAIVTGVTGQDGSYLAEYLLNKNYMVFGTVRRHATDNLQNIRHLIDNPYFFTKDCDLTSASNVASVITEIIPDEIYNLAAQSDVRISFDMPDHTMQVNTLGVLNILEAVRNIEFIRHRYIKVYQASTSEMFGLVQEVPQKETTPFYPRSPYGVSKLAAYWLTVNYREAYDIFACNGILFNHESPRRGLNFVTQKVVQGIKNIQAGRQKLLHMGNLDAMRDWGHAKDYVEAMYLMMQQEKPDDFVISTGEQHSVREFIELTGKYFGYDIAWNGSGLNEIGYDKKTGRDIIMIDPNFYRPTEVQTLLGDCTKAKTVLNWKPKYNFETLVEDMCRGE